MSDTQSGSLPDSEPAAGAAGSVGFGAALRDAREQLGLSVAEAAERIKIAPRQIEALEKEDFDRLPETVFVRGFVRSYAKLLQIDPAPLIAALPSAAPEQSVAPGAVVMTETVPMDQGESRAGSIWLAAVVIAVLMAGALGRWFTHSAHEPQTSMERTDASAVPDAEPPKASAPEVSAPASSSVPATIPVSAPASAPTAQAPKRVEPTPPPAPAPTAASTNVPIRLAFEAKSWVKVTDKSGNVVLSKTGEAGDESAVDGKAPFDLVIGNASGVKLYYKGNPVELKPSTNASSGVARLTLE